jgi:hypothetical protein
VAFLLAVALATSSYTIVGDRSVGPLRVGSATLAQATAVYGPPPHVLRSGNAGACGARWPSQHLYLSFLAFGSDSCASGVLVYGVAWSRMWRTDKNLRVGDSVARLRARYPAARAHHDGWWLLTRRACKDVGGQRFPGLKARATRSRGVRAFVVSANVCD